MEKEELFSVLQHENVEGLSWVNEDDNGFSRTLEFVVRGVKYKIEWWHNQMYLCIGEARVLFNYLEIHGCWPNGFKENLNFCESRPKSMMDVAKKVCIIPLTEYQEQTKNKENNQ